MSVVDRICADATAPALCTRETHARITTTAETFAAGTVYVGPGFGNLTLGNCRLCGSTIAMEDEWADEPTLPMTMACARQPERNS